MNPTTRAATDVSSPTGPAAPRSARGQILLLATVFFFAFLGAGAFQQFLFQALGGTEDARALRSTILAVVYGSFLVWRIGVAWTSRWLGEWTSIVLGALLYSGLPVLILFGAPAWLLVVGAAAWGWGAASLWVASGARVLHLSRAGRYGRGAAAIYVGTLSGLALGLIAQSAIGHRWGTHAMVGWASTVTPVAAVLGAALWRGGAPQDRPSLQVYGGLLLDREILLAGVMLFAAAITYPVLLSSFGDMVNAQKSLAAVGPVVVWFHIAKAVLSYAGGWANDRWGARWTLAIGFLGGAGGLTLAIGLKGVAGMGVAAFCLGIPSGMVPVVATAMVGDKVKGTRRMMALGSLFVWRDGGIVVGLVAAELLRRSLQLQGSYVALALVLVGFAVASWWLGDGTRQSASAPRSPAREG